MIPCLSCKANCCKQYDVFIDHVDLVNLYKVRGNYSFLKKVEYKKNFGYVPKFTLWENGKKMRWVLCLSNPGGICTFLKNDICSVYHVRPNICRTYPFFVDMGKIKEMKNICPVKWILSENQKDDIINDYNHLLLNFLTFETICDNWNKIVVKEDNLDNFLNFVQNYKF